MIPTFTTLYDTLSTVHLSITSTPTYSYQHTIPHPLLFMILTFTTLYYTLSTVYLFITSTRQSLHQHLIIPPYSYQQTIPHPLLFMTPTFITLYDNSSHFSTISHTQSTSEMNLHQKLINPTRYIRLSQIELPV